MRCALDSADSQFSDSGAAFLPRSGVLSRHDTIVLVIPRDYRRRRASPRGWRDRCRSQGHGPSGRRSWQPMRTIAPASLIARLIGSLVNSREACVSGIAHRAMPRRRGISRFRSSCARPARFLQPAAARERVR